MSIILYSIPVFFLLIGVEVLVAWRMKRRVYRFSDSFADLGCGIIQQVTGLFSKGVGVAAYAAVAQQFALQHWTDLPAWPVQGPWYGLAFTWGFAFVAYDFAYYWAHRLSHDTRLGWMAHVVHHSSEEYNLTVALRQSALQTFFTLPFYLPLALLGIPWEVFLSVGAINLVYQFWIHTRLVGKLHPWVEAVMNTPSHHRVHHGKNPQYIDRNHAGVFIVWDKLFGTFEPEAEEPVYGITTPLKSWNPTWANLHTPLETLRQLTRMRSLKDALLTLLRKPGWRPDYLGGPVEVPQVDRRSYGKFEVKVPPAITAYAFVHFALTLGVALALLLNVNQLGLPQQLALATAVVLSLTTLGGLLQRARWGLATEAARMLALATAAAFALAWPGWGLAWWHILAVLLLALASLVLLWAQRKAIAGTPLHDLVYEAVQESPRVA